MNEVIADKKDINNEISLNYFQYQNSLFLVEDLINTEQDKNEIIMTD